MSIQPNDGMVSFRHELFQEYFASEALLESHGNADALARVLRLPINQELVEFAVGSLTGSADVGALLTELDSIPLFGACLNGLCGMHAKATAKSLASAAIGRLEEFVRAARFDRGEPIQGRYLQLTCDTSACDPLRAGDRVCLIAAATYYDDQLLD